MTLAAAAAEEVVVVVVDWEEELRDGERVERFARDFLGPDGVFLLRMVEMNCSTLLVAEMARELYRVFSLGGDTGGRVKSQ